MNHLLTDTLRFLQENFEEDTSWTVKSSQMHLKEKRKVVMDPKPAPAPKAITLPTPQKVEQSTAQQPTALPVAEPVIQPVVQPVAQETPKPIMPGTPLKVESLSSAIKELFPQFSTNAQLPKDKDLRVNPVYKRVLKADVILFSFREGKDTDLFLQNISSAINSHFASSTVFDVKRWEISGESFELFFKQINAKLFICSEALYNRSSLLPFLKEIPSSSEKFLGPSKLILLQPFDTYFSNPLQKKELWKNLCATLKKITPSQESS